MEASQRKRLGAWYTPSALVTAVCNEVRRCTEPRTVLDPACGDGRFLLPFAGRSLLIGVDIDPAAIDALPKVVTGHVDDALHRDWGDLRVDALVGNPPFLNQLSSATTRGGASRWGGGPYADSAAEFLSMAVHLVRPGGYVGLVLPQSMLAARDAAAIRAMVDERASLRWFWWSDEAMFDAAVHVWAGVWQVGGAPGAIRRSYGPAFVEQPPMSMPSGSWWSSLISGETDHGNGGPTLGDIADFRVDFRAQYYGLVGAVDDHGDGPPLITCGLIDPRLCRWGERPVRFAGTRYDAPRVHLDRLSPPMRRWAEQRLVPKVLIANQTKTIEAVHDSVGSWIPSVPVLSATSAQPERVIDTLERESTVRFVQSRAAGSGLSPGALRLTPRLLADVPLPGTSG